MGERERPKRKSTEKNDCILDAVAGERVAPFRCSVAVPLTLPRVNLVYSAT